MKMSLLYIHFVLILLTLQVDKGYGSINCFVCDSLRTPSCKHPIQLTSQDTAYIFNNCTACRWIRTGDDDDHAVLRECLYTSKSHQCSDGTFGQVTSYECFCNSNLCNSGPGWTCSRVILFMFVTLSVMSNSLFVV